jgi:NTP pyrophosphatase (non-canonical NTP hydrolase)
MIELGLTQNGRPDPPYHDEVFEYLRDVQAAADAVYGRLEVERALVWTVEELGELAQAVRRGEGATRLEEELGQLAAWTFCLANILGLDLTRAVHRAFADEVDRQTRKYGHVRPYRLA